MCTLTFAWQVFDDARLVVAANRDEAVDRPSLPPRQIDDERKILAPLDEEAGGTWIGVNADGVFAGITNRWTDVDLAGERSRGLLVRDALCEPSAVDALSAVEDTLAEYEYEPFNLVIADATDCRFLEWDGELAVTHLESGVHVVVNVGGVDEYEVPASHAEVGEKQAANARKVRDELQPEPRETAGEWRQRAANVLGDHDYGICVHADGYGTRSSSLIAFGDTIEYWYADGPPCENAYERIPVGLGGEL